jgi:hypothetical protein
MLFRIALEALELSVDEATDAAYSLSGAFSDKQLDRYREHLEDVTVLCLTATVYMAQANFMLHPAHPAKEEWAKEAIERGWLPPLHTTSCGKVYRLTPKGPVEEK